MRTKTLLIAAAALAVGVISSQAQPVYSQNIVGYVNSSIAAGFTALNTPLDVAGGNSLTNILQNPQDNNVNDQNYGNGIFDGDYVYIWNGTGFTRYTIDSGWTTGVGNAGDTAAVTGPTINAGTLYYFVHNVTNSVTNTFVGTVHVDGAATGTQIAGVNTNTLPSGFQFVASKLPIGGGISSVLGLTNWIYDATTDGGNSQLDGNGVIDGAKLYFPNINPANGVFLGYNIYTFDSGWSTGFGNAGDTAQVAEPQVQVGVGFVFDNNISLTGYGGPGSYTYKWVQGL